MARRRHTVRIIGGKWKGRKLKVADRPGLRPTMGRVRGAVFNWLVAEVAGARVLDLFAGTGALAFEALSRGAAWATLVERDRVVAAHLRAEAERLGADCEVLTASARSWLKRQVDWNWDLVFVDPPFQSDLASEVMSLLAERNAIVYLEQDVRDINDFSGWDTIKSGHAGDCRFRLLRSRDQPSGLFFNSPLG